jgi:DNA-binding HxlR family transcriptional regulator
MANDDSKEVPFNCGMEAVLDLVGGKWKLLILYHLIHGEQLRFSELRRMVGNVSEKMLSQQLKEMVNDSLVRRIDFRTVPPHVEYALTAFGKGLAKTLQPVCAWGAENMEEIGAIASARAVRNA